MAVLEYDTGVRPDELTSASVWRALAGSEITDELLEWPPHMFAMTDLVFPLSLSATSKRESDRRRHEARRARWFVDLAARWTWPETLASTRRSGTVGELV